MVEKEKKTTTIGKPREFKVITEEGRFKDILIIPYTIDDATHTVTVDKEGVTPEIIEKAIKEDAAKFSSVDGKTITI